MGVGTLMAVCCFGLFWWSLNRDSSESPQNVERARTILFVSLSFAQLFYVLAIRSSSESFFTLGLWSNSRLTGAVAAGIVLQMAVVYVPLLQPFFHTTGISAGDLLIAILFALPAFLAVETRKMWRVAPT